MHVVNTRLMLQPSSTLVRSAANIALTVVLACMSVGLSIAAGYRHFGIGRDYIEYINFYNSVTPFFISGYSRFEIGFEISAWFFGSVLNLPYELFASIIIFMSLSIKFYLIKLHLRSSIIAVISYLLLFYPTHEYTQVRAAIAIAFGYLAIHHLIYRRHFLFFFFCILAFSFHSSTLILSISAFAIHITPTRLYRYIIFTAPIALYFSYDFIIKYIFPLFIDINPLVFSYIDNTDIGTQANVLSGTNILLAISLCYAIFFKRSDKDGYSSVFMFLSLIAFGWLFMFQNSPVIALRTYYVLIVGTIFFSYRERISIHSSILQTLVMLAGCWSFYRSVEEGLIFQ